LGNKIAVEEIPDEQSRLPQIEQAVMSFTKGMSWAFVEPPERDSTQYWDRISRLQEAVKGTFSNIVLGSPNIFDGPPIKLHSWAG
jgi:hypothetical protein